MPLPDTSRLKEYALKGVHLGLRQVAQAPEHRQARRLAATAVPVAAPGAPRVAILSPRDWAAQVQWEAVIGHALRARGAHVSHLICGGGLELCDRANAWEAPPMPCHSCTRYVEDSLEAHGVAPERLAADWADDQDTWPELDALTLPELAQATSPDGLPLGAMTEIPLKWFLLRTDLHEEPLAAPTWRAFLRSAARIEKAVGAALDRLRPDVVLLLNGLFLFESVTWELCRRRGIDVVTYERGFINDSLVFSRGLPACMLDVSDAWPARRAKPLAPDEEERLDAYLEDRRHGRRTIDQYWKDVRFEVPERSSEGKVVTLFTNLTWDSAVIGQDIAFPSIQDWLVDAVELFRDRPQDRLVIRIHPAEVKLPGKQTREPMGEVLERRVGEVPDNIEVIEADDTRSSYPLMEASDLGLVYTSTAGLELALMGVPVVVAGETHYRGKGFTIDVSSPAGFRKAIADALDGDSPADPAPLARRYGHLFFFEAPFAPRGVEEHVLGLARLTVDSVDELAPGQDADLDRLCELILATDGVARGDVRVA